MRRIFLLLSISLFALGARAQTVLNNDSLVSDFCYLVQQLEATHPDPYQGFGGKISFHQAVNEVVSELKKDAWAKTKFVNRVNAFLSSLHDGHTHLQDDQISALGRLVQRIKFRVIPDGLVVDGISTSHKDLLGAKLDSINGICVGELLKRVERIYPCENLYGNYNALHWEANTEDLLRKLGTAFTDSVRYSLHSPEGKSVTLSLPLVNEESLTNVPITFTPENTGIPSKNLGYQFVDNGKRTMVLRISSIMARENYEFCLKNNWDGSYDDIQNFYKNSLHAKMPLDTMKALAGIPSFSETFANMLSLMKKNKSSNLIVDLRGNGGGWTPIVLPTLLMLYGDEYLTKDLNTEFCRLISPLYLHKINSTLSQFNSEQGTHYRIGDYAIEKDEQSDRNSVDSLRIDFIKNCMSASRPLLAKLAGKPLYRPQHIYVVTDAETFSAAFHYAFYLWRMGATVVGVPSSQAPNTYMENTPFCLPYSHLNGNISNSAQIFLPTNDKRAKVFYPDLIPSYQDYQRHHFDRNAEILYLLDVIAKGKPSSPLK